MNINQPIAGVPAGLLPFKVVHPMFYEALNITPFGSVIGADPMTSPFVLMYTGQGQGGQINWGATPNMDSNNIASGYAPYSDAIDTKQYATAKITLDKIKWVTRDRNQDYQKIATPVTDPNTVLLNLARVKYEQRLTNEIIQALTFGGTGVQGRFTVGVNNSKPVTGRLFYGNTAAGGVTPYAPNNANDLPTQVDADLNGITAQLSTSLFRSLSTAANSLSPQSPLNPAYKRNGTSFSQVRKFFGFFSQHAMAPIYQDADFKSQQLARGWVLPGQANPMEDDRHVGEVSSILLTKVPEMDTLSSFVGANGTYDIGFIVGADALRICQSTLSDGMKIVTNIGSFLAERAEAVESLFSYFRGYKVPMYWNKATGATNDGTDPVGLAESGIIYVITKR